MPSGTERDGTVNMSCLHTWAKRIQQHFLCLVLIASLILYFLTYLGGWYGTRPIRSDGKSYYAYLPSLLIHGNLSYEQMTTEDLWGIWRHPDTQRWVNKYNVGVAVMVAPFFAVAHGLTWVMQSSPDGSGHGAFNYPQDGYSLFYQHAAGLSGLFFVMAGLVMMKHELTRLFGCQTAILTLTLFLLGTNLWMYATGNPVMSHTYSFFLFAWFMRLTRRWYESPSNALSMALGLVAGLIVLVRTNNVLFLLFFPAYDIRSIRDIPLRLATWQTHVGRLGILLVSALLAFLPQLILWKATTGHMVVYSYGQESFQLTSPKIFQVLFSLRCGILFWSPVLALSLVGVAFTRKQAPAYFLPLLVYLPLQVYLVSAWWDPAWGGGFPHRAFIESYALLLFPTASLLKVAHSTPMRRVVILYALLAVSWTLFLMKLSYTYEIGIWGLDRSALFDLFWSRWHALKSGIRVW